eukprot:6788933-Prymnesium_polylepis.1
MEATAPMTAPSAAACPSSPPAEEGQEPATFVPRALLRPRRDGGQSARPADGVSADPDARSQRASSATLAVQPSEPTGRGTLPRKIAI